MKVYIPKYLILCLNIIHQNKDFITVMENITNDIIKNTEIESHNDKFKSILLFKC